MGIPIKIRSYNTGLSLYENGKSNLMTDRMAKNRWGNLFKKYYSKNKDVTTDGTLGIYNFTEGMRASVMSITIAQNDLDRVNAFLTVFDDKMNIYNGLTQTTSTVVVLATSQNAVTGTPVPTIVDVAFTFSADPLDQTYVDWVNNSSELAYYLGFLTEDDVSDTLFQSVVVEIPFTELKEFLDELVVTLTQSIESLVNDTGRVGDDLELISHLGIEQTLFNEISQPQKIQKIWFSFQKEVSTPLISDGAGGVTQDPNYAWWQEEQFQKKTVVIEGKTHIIYGIADAVEDFQNYCIFEGDIVRLKEEVFELPGWKVYWFVNTFLTIDVSVRKKSLLRRIFDFVLLIVSIVLTVVSTNPAWLKVVIIATQVGGYFGGVSPRLSLIVAGLTFSYGALNTNFSAMSSLQVFSWAIKNVEQVFKMMQIYESIELREQMLAKAKEANANERLVQQQEEVMEFIYNRSTNQYEEMATVLYHLNRTG